MLERQITRLRDWYRGELEPPQPNDGSLIILRPNPYKKSRSAAVATVLFEFWKNHWQWIIPLAVATLLGLLRLK
jgi:hypothetical protein